MNINIVNKKTHIPTEHDVYVGRPTSLGNPYDLSYGREECISRFRCEFQYIMIYGRNSQHLNYEAVMQQLKLIQQTHTRYGEVNLVCWCAPLPCHASVIVEHIYML